MNPPPVIADGGGKRYDAGKPRTDLLPPDALIELGKLYAAGAQKYGDRNWERGMPWSKMVGPLSRHYLLWMLGYKTDPETGLSHMVAVAWNAIGLVTYELRGIGTDDVHPSIAFRGDPRPARALLTVLLLSFIVALALGFALGRIHGGS